jgi:hypothetical protein
MWTGFTPFWIGCGNWLLLVRRLIWNTKDLRNSSICAPTVEWIDLYYNFKSLLFTVLSEKETLCFECVRACVHVRGSAFVILRNMHDIYYLRFFKLRAMYSDTLILQILPTSKLKVFGVRERPWSLQQSPFPHKHLEISRFLFFLIRDGQQSALEESICGRRSPKSFRNAC